MGIPPLAFVMYFSQIVSLSLSFRFPRRKRKITRVSKKKTSILRLAALGPPLGRAESRDGLELAVAELDVGGADHARLEAQGRADVVVDARGGVVAHDEVVAVGVLHLVDGDWFGEGEDAPVGEAADDAAVFEDEGADGLGDFFYLGEAARPDNGNEFVEHLCDSLRGKFWRKGLEDMRLWRDGLVEILSCLPCRGFAVVKV